MDIWWQCNLCSRNGRPASISHLLPATSDDKSAVSIMWIILCTEVFDSISALNAHHTPKLLLQPVSCPQRCMLFQVSPTATLKRITALTTLWLGTRHCQVNTKCNLKVIYIASFLTELRLKMQDGREIRVFVYGLSFRRAGLWSSNRLLMGPGP